MSLGDNASGEPDGGAMAALASVEESQMGARHLTGPAGWAVAAVACAWALFQLSLPQVLPLFVILNSDQVRTIHLAFAIVLVFLCFPAFKHRKTRGVLSFLSARRGIPAADILLATVAAAAALYYIWDYEGIGARQGKALAMRDLVMGATLIVLLLEAARRAFGPALSCVAATFMLYGLFAEYMPGPLALKAVSISRLINQQTMGSQGIYGVPLRVSATTVFLFVLLGAMLEKTGGGRYFVQLAFSLLGRYKGGPAKAAVCASGLTGMVSGSSIANVVTTGTFTIPLMKRCGYPAVKAAAIEVAASTNGQLMPPIMGAAAFIIAEYCNVSYMEIVRAAFIPAVTSYLALLFLTHIEASKLGLRGMAKDELPRFGKVLFGGLHFLAPLAVLVWMLLKGFSPPLAVFYTIVMLAVLVLADGAVRGRSRGVSAPAALAGAARLLGQSLVAGAHAMMGVGVACATAGIIVGMVNLGLGGRITEIVSALSGGSIVLVLVFTAVASLVLGMGLPTTATYIVMASLVAGVIVELGARVGITINPIAAHLFCFFFGILADDTPPVGLAAYAGAAIAKSDPIKTGIQGFLYDLRTAILPFMFVFNSDLLLLGVTNWLHIAVIFIATTVALFAFASLTQNFLLRRNRIHETALLALSAGVLLRPALPGELLDRWGAAAHLGPAGPLLASKFLWYAVGTAVFLAVCLLQKQRGGPDAGRVCDPPLNR